jgi:hypothetical protein
MVPGLQKVSAAGAAAARATDNANAQRNREVIGNMSKILGVMESK